MQIQAKVRYLRRTPGDIDQQIIQKDREDLTGLIVQLNEAQNIAGVAVTNSSPRTDPCLVDEWDDLINDEDKINADEVPRIRPDRQSINTTLGPVPIEDQLIALPSNGNVIDIHRTLEQTHRISQADYQLNRIRDLIAEKSFQYSHVNRVAPRKSVKTRSRAVVKKLNHQIASHCRVYSRCRSCLITLGADHLTLSRLRILKPDDIKASTAILNPNEPGSTSIKLPWIWQTAKRHQLGLLATNAGIADECDENTEPVGSDADNSNIMFECVSISI